MRPGKRSLATLLAALAFSLTWLYFAKIIPAQSLPKSKAHVIRRTDWAGQSKYRPDHILVRFRPGTAAELIASAHLATGAEITKSWRTVDGLQLVRLPGGARVKDFVQAYRNNSIVLYAEPDYVVHALGTPNDPQFQQLWGLQNTGQAGGKSGADIHATQAWNVSTGSSSIVVGVIDTGIDYHHEDLSANVWSNPASFTETVDGVTVNCAAGTHGLNAITGRCDPLDDNSHGSHVSGTIGAAGNNSIGVVGVNWNVQIMACKFLDASGSGFLSDAITCLDFVKSMKDRGVNVVATNNSWGGGGFSQALGDAIQAQQQDGILFVAAAGNDFSDNDIVPVYPANYFYPNMLTVAATSRFDEVAAFSDLGRHTVYLGAPGQEILSTTPNNTYSVFSGTSMATPHVTGVAALLAAQTPGRDWRAIKNLILAGGDTNLALSETITGRRLNAFGAMSCSNSTVTERLQPVANTIPATVGQPVTLAVLNINCGQPGGPVQVTVSPGGQSITLLDNGTGADQATGDGIYTALWTPSALGNYSLTFPNGDQAQVTVLNNYTVGETKFNYQTISGSNLNLGDDDVGTITSPFPVQFGGGDFSRLFVSSNGTISFTNAFSEYFNWYLPLNFLASQNPQNPPDPTNDLPVVTLIAPFWQDLYPVKGTSQNVFWDVTGSSPNRQLVIEWRNVRSFECLNDSGATVTFQVVFPENSSNFTFNYLNAAFGGGCSSQDYGGGATVGMEVTQNVGTEWSINQQAIGSGMSLLWTIPPANPTPNAAPTATSISPANVTSGSGNTVVTITGTGFVPSSQATLYPITELVTTYLSSTQLQVLFTTAELSVPTFGTPLQINVSNPAPGGGTSQAVFLNITPAQNPAITAISQQSAPAGSFGFNLTVNGSGFFQAYSNVLWNGGGGLTTYVSPNQLTFAVTGTMLQTAGTVNIQVQNFTNSFSNIVPFTITPASAPAPIVAPTPAPPAQPGSPTLPAAAKPQVIFPERFQGWEYSAHRGTDYLSHFLRPRADLAPPPPTLLTPAAVQSSAIQGATTLPPIAGFNFRPTLPADFQPSAVVTGDFNGDGHIDWAVANSGSNNIWIYLGKGDGTAQLPTIIPLTGVAPIGLVAADMNHDGKLDLIVAEADTGTVGVLLGNGDGTFGPELEFYVPGAAGSLAVADFNGDGNLDVVVGIFGNFETGSLAFLPGDGTGKLGQPLTHFGRTNGGYLTLALAVADLNGDGLPDLVAIDYNVSIDLGLQLQGQGPGNGVRVYLNEGDGSFKYFQQFFFDATTDQGPGLGRAATAVALADVNKDGCTDAVVLDTLGVATFVPGRCDGSFDTSSSRIFGTGIIAGAASLVDLNGDGKLDLVSSAFPFQADPTAPTTMGNSLSVQFGDGTGNFSSPLIFRGEPGMHSLAVADLNGDGHPDVITANQDSDTVSVYLNDGTGGFGGPTGGYVGYLAGGQMHAIVDAPVTNFAFVDVNGDGHKDLITLETGSQFPLPTELTVMLGNSSGGFGAPIRTPIFDNQADVFDLAFADFRNKGKPDLVVIGETIVGNPSAALSYAVNNGDGTFQRSAVTPLPNLFPFQIVVGDFNGDGKQDIVLVSFSNSPGGTAGASLVPFLGNGDGTFRQGTAVSFASTAIGAAFAGDFNHDGRLDLLVAGNQLISTEQNALYELLGNGDGTFQPPVLLFAHPDVTSYFTVADLNKDNLPDVVEEMVARQAVDNSISRSFQVHLCQLDGSFKAGASYGPFRNEFSQALIFGTPDKPLRPVGPTLADFNGDGNLDIVAHIVSFGESITPGVITGGAPGTSLEILAGNGDGTFTPSNITFHLGQGAAPQLYADVNGDKRADMVKLDAYTSSYDILTAKPGDTFTMALVSDPIVGPNGKLRIILANPSSAGTTLQLSASDSNISVPAAINIPTGSLSQDIDFHIGSSFNSKHVFSFTAQSGQESHTAFGTQALAQSQVGFVAVSFNVPVNTPVVAPSQSFTYPLLIASIGGYATEIHPSCSDLPAGASCQFDANPIELSPGQVLLQSVTLVTQSSTPLGAYAVNALFTDGSITQQVSTPLNVGDFKITIAPPAQTVGTSDFTSFTVTLQGLENYSAVVELSCNGLPTGVICPITGDRESPSPQGTPVFFQLHTQNTSPATYNFTIDGLSGPLSHSVSAQLIVTGGSFSGSVSPPSAIIPVGSSKLFNVTVNPVSGFNGLVNLACANPPPSITCSFNPGQVTLVPNGSSTAMLTVMVNSKPAAATAQPSSRTPISSRSPIGIAARAVVLLLATTLIFASRLRSARKPRRAVLASVWVACLVLSLIAGISSCGGGGGGAPSGGGGGGGGGGGTPVTVEVAIQGSSGGTTINFETLSITVP